MTVGPVSARTRAGDLWDLFTLFARLGATAFGGPAAHIALMEHEVVRRRGWLSEQEFLDLLGATNLIPGPNSTEMAIHIGHRRRGWLGLLVAGCAFIVPAALIVFMVAWAYVRYGALPEVRALLYATEPVIIAVVLQALVGLGRAAIRSSFLGLLFLASLAATIAGVNEIAVLVMAGLAAAGRERLRTGSQPPALLLPVMGTLSLGLSSGFSLGVLFLTFLKVGAVLFGSGYVLLAFLRADLVERLHWLTEPQLLDAVAIGQATPGPLFTTATFIGYVLGGTAGAVVATIGIFLPAFVFVAASGPLIPKLRASPSAGAFLDGVNVASLGLMSVVTWHLGRHAVTDVLTLFVLGVSGLLLVRFRVNSLWLIVAGAVLGLVVAR
jgi:chromate transporter